MNRANFYLFPHHDARHLAALNPMVFIRCLNPNIDIIRHPVLIFTWRRPNMLAAQPVFVAASNARMPICCTLAFSFNKLIQVVNIDTFILP
jgi:hypothetical protein